MSSLQSEMNSSKEAGLSRVEETVVADLMLK